MATVTASIRVSKKSTKAFVRFRLRDGRNIDLFHKSELEVNPEKFDSEKQTIKAKVIYNPDARATFNNAVADRKNIMLTIYNAELNKAELTSELMERKIDMILNPNNYIPVVEEEQSFFETYSEFLNKHKISNVRKNNYRVIFRALQRYELYVSKLMRIQFKLHLDTVTPDTLHDMEAFFKKEITIFTEMPEIYKAFPESRTPKARGQNTINDIFTKLRTFFKWSIKNKKTKNNPFDDYSIESCKYGSPYFITNEERNILYNTDLSHRPQLAIQRDIYVFQCFIGCRVSDLYRMTEANIIDGFIEYIARKTQNDDPITVRLPLSKTAIEIIYRYPNNPKGQLLPFISQQHYNVAIKDAFLLAGLTRIVTVLNPTTREEEKRPLNEIASSHIARRTLIGNLFKKVKDQNLISSVTGHKEGSKAFARYRNIDDDMKTELISLLE